MKLKFFLFCMVFFVQKSFAQDQDAWIFFNDKPSEFVYLASPLTMLSQQSIDRRMRYNIDLDVKDVPIESTYYNQVKNTTGITIKAKSKWLNALHVQGSQTAITNLNNLSFVEKIEWADKTIASSKTTITSSKNKPRKKSFEVVTDYNYGNSANQIEMLKGNILHEKNFTGTGMNIAILDGGFINVNNAAPFNKLRTNNQILEVYNFVKRNENIYEGSSHGTSVLSTIGGFVDGTLVGTAPDANFYLFVTEDVSQEVPLEESLWVEAAEKADSLGVDVINTSLGYSSFFDDVKHNYTYEDMDGKTTFISRGAAIAFTRGIFLVNSAGNEGNDPWKHINAPADVDNVLSIGAVNAGGEIVSFSSYGPTSDNRVKPDVSAQGAATVLVNGSGNVATANGTSFSSPVIAGVIACLWQAFPEKTNLELLQAIRESGHKYPSHTNQEGYGIPNFETIFNKLSVVENDIDGDGVDNTLDECPNTPLGANVNASGCLVLPSNNFNIEVTSETCQNKNNGIIKLTASKEYNYKVDFKGASYSFNDKTLSFEDLAIGIYEICISINEQNYKQCYSFEINEGITISGKVSVKSKSVVVELTEGTKPFSVFVNGNKKLETDFNEFEIDVNHKDLIEVKTSIACEGVFLKEIFFDDIVNVYPNPTTNTVKLNLPNELKNAQISLFNNLGTKLELKFRNQYTTEIDLSHLSKGIYFISVDSQKESLKFKVVKN